MDGLIAHGDATTRNVSYAMPLVLVAAAHYFRRESWSTATRTPPCMSISLMIDAEAMSEFSI